MARWTFYCLTTIFLFTGISGNGQTDTLKITAGQGVDNVLLKRSSQAQIENLGKGKFSKEQGTGIACGIHGSRRFKWETYKNDSVGLTFEFKSDLASWPFQIFRKTSLVKITVTKNAKTTDGFVIGKSTRADVIRLYGLQAGWKNESYISYADKGIAFDLDGNGIVSAIEIFQPSCILNPNNERTKTDSTSVMQEEMTVFFAKTGDDILIDSLAKQDSAYIKLQIPFVFPGNGSQTSEGDGVVIYGTGRSDKNNCNFNIHIRISADSISLITKPLSPDPCRGHTDWSDAVWELFGNSIHATCTQDNNRVRIVWNDGKSIMILQRTVKQ